MPTPRKAALALARTSEKNNDSVYGSGWPAGFPLNAT